MCWHGMMRSLMGTEDSTLIVNGMWEVWLVKGFLNADWL
jgi:hypothetical protein